MMDRETIVRLVRESDAFQGEARYLERGGYQLTEQPRLFKHLEDDLVRVVFATNVTEVVEGTVVAMVTLFDQRQKYNIYAHAICAGPGVNILLKARFNPMPQARPQPGVAGEAAIAKFVAWKEASWTKFLNDELVLGTETASSLWIATFWKALDRMFGGGHLVNYDPDAILAAHV